MHRSWQRRYKSPAQEKKILVSEQGLFYEMETYYSTPAAHASTKVLCSGKPLHHIRMRDFKDEESDIEQQGQVGVLIRVQILATISKANLGLYWTTSGMTYEIFSNPHHSGIVQQALVQILE